MSGDSIAVYSYYCRETEGVQIMISETNIARFATEGFRIKRCNPDTTTAVADRTLGFVGLIDISTILDATKKAKLAVKLDAGAWIEKDIDFSSGVTVTALSPTNAAAKLTAAGFEGITFSVDTATGRLKASATSATELQIKSALAGALDFGMGRKHGGFGVYYIKYFNDETISITLPNDMKDKEEIDLEGAKGTVTRMILPGKHLGVSPVISTKFKNDELLQMIQGGIYIPATATQPATYEPPTSQAGGSPLFTLDIFAPLYSGGNSKEEQNLGMERRIFWSCSGTEGDVPMEAKSWATFAYNMNATEYTDEEGKLHAAEKRFTYDATLFELLRIYDV
jgi:hypothetical protein